MRSITSIEDVNIVTSEPLSEKQQSNFARIRSTSFEPGRYMFVKMSHVTSNVQTSVGMVKSPRVLAFKLDDNNQIQYARTWPLSKFTTQGRDINAGVPQAEVYRNEQGLVRIKPGQDCMRGHTVYATESFIPKFVDDKGFFHITENFVVSVDETFSVLNPAYVQTAAGWDVDTTDDGYAKWVTQSMTPFRVIADTVTPAMVKAAKDYVAGDSALKQIKLEC